MRASDQLHLERPQLDLVSDSPPLEMQSPSDCEGNALRHSNDRRRIRGHTRAELAITERADRDMEA